MTTATPVINPRAWRRVRDGWVRIPPARCPGCGVAWSLERRDERPRQRFVTCACGAERHHPTWECPTCPAIVAVGCQDPTAWAPVTVRPGHPVTARHTTPG